MTTGEDGEVLREKIATILEEEFFDECAFDAQNCAKAVMALIGPVMEENERLRQIISFADEALIPIKGEWAKQTRENIAQGLAALSPKSP
jgi:hypothetical protein